MDDNIWNERSKTKKIRGARCMGMRFIATIDSIRHAPIDRPEHIASGICGGKIRA